MIIARRITPNTGDAEESPTLKHFREKCKIAQLLWGKDN